MDRWTVLYWLLYYAISLGHETLRKIIPTRRDVKFAPKNDYGLVLADPFKPERTGTGIDIIFVHGLGSNPDTTWHRRNESYVCKDSDGHDAVDTDACGPLAGKKYVNWVTDFFHDDLPLHLRKSTRAFFYNYDSYWMRDGIEERRARLDQELFEHVSDMAVKNPDRVFVLVGHSYGGLVIKEALLSAHAYAKHRPVNIFQQTQAAVFMGTPHRGSSSANMGAKFARFLQFCGLDSFPDIVEAITYDSPELRDMHRRFEAVSQDLRIVNFYETLKVADLGGLHNDYVVNEASATLDRPKGQNLGLRTRHTGLNKFWRRDSDYKMVSSKLIQLMEAVAQEGYIAIHVYVVPPELAKEYTERTELYGYLKGNLTDPGNIVVVVGLGGMGKTQLTLKYAESHKHRYDTTFWIDARSEAAIISSFYRCARALNIVPEYPRPDEGIRPQDHPTVHLVLQWLQRRDARYGESLLIFDNVDDLSTGIMSIIPPELHGSIILTSRNTQCFTMLPERSRGLHVGDMAPSEAQSLLLRYMNLNTTAVSEDVLHISHQICEAMHWTALAVHLAGAHLRMDTAGEPQASLSQTRGLWEKFLRDIQAHREDIFKAETVKGMSAYDLTIYTVLDSSLNAIDEMFPNLPSRQILAFFAHIEVIDIPYDMFGLVAKGLNNEDNGVARKLPSWLRDLLPVNQDNEWDDFKFRQSLKPLWRYGLIESSTSHGFLHVSIHALVRWKAQLDGEERRNIGPSWDVILAMFHASGIHQVWADKHPSQTSVDILEFIRWNAPGPTAFLTAPIDFKSSVLDMIAEQYELADRNEDARRLYSILAHVSNKLSAATPEYYRTTLARVVNLMTLRAVTRLWVGRSGGDPLEISIRALLAVGIEDTPLSYNALKEIRAYLIGRSQYAMTEQVLVAMIRKSLAILGPSRLSHWMDMRKLAELYMQQERWDEAEVLLKETIENVGPRESIISLFKSDLALVYKNQGRLEEVELLGGV